MLLHAFQTIYSKVINGISIQNVKQALDYLFASIFSNEEILTITSDGQTAFTLIEEPISDSSLKIFLNGQLMKRGTDYTRVAKAITWIGTVLLTTDHLVSYYNDGEFEAIREVYYNANFDNVNSSYEVLRVGTNGDTNFSFKVPDDFRRMVSCELIGIISTGVAGSGKNIDINSDYGRIGEPLNQHTESDNTSTYDFTGKTNQITKILDLSIILNNLSAGDLVGIFVDHNVVGGNIDYLGIKLRYGA